MTQLVPDSAFPFRMTADLLTKCLYRLGRKATMKTTRGRAAAIA
jgi:hypothetical protein